MTQAELSSFHRSNTLYSFIFSEWHWLSYIIMKSVEETKKNENRVNKQQRRTLKIVFPSFRATRYVQQHSMCLLQRRHEIMATKTRLLLLQLSARFCVFDDDSAWDDFFNYFGTQPLGESPEVFSPRPNINIIIMGFLWWECDASIITK